MMAVFRSLPIGATRRLVPDFQLIVYPLRWIPERTFRAVGWVQHASLSEDGGLLFIALW